MKNKFIINNNIKYFLPFLLFLLISESLFSQSENQLIREGNKNFKKENYQDAEIYYRRVLEENPVNSRALYNLANTLYRQGRYEEAINILDALTHMEAKKIDKSDVHHNLGNAQLGAQKIRESIESYKNALKIDPDDHDTRYNLAYAMNLLDEQDEQPQDDPDDGEDDTEQQEDDRQQDRQDENKTQKDEMQQRPDQISQEDAQRILDALNQQEQKLQENIKREESELSKIKPEKEW